MEEDVHTQAAEQTRTRTNFPKQNTKSLGTASHTKKLNQKKRDRTLIGEYEWSHLYQSMSWLKKRRICVSKTSTGVCRRYLCRNHSNYIYFSNRFPWIVLFFFWFLWKYLLFFLHFADKRYQEVCGEKSGMSKSADVTDASRLFQKKRDAYIGKILGIKGAD